jgi:hypothetical protein
MTQRAKDLRCKEGHCRYYEECVGMKGTVMRQSQRTGIASTLQQLGLCLTFKPSLSLPTINQLCEGVGTGCGEVVSSESYSAPH